MLRIDFGSGYNPKKGFKTCDITQSPYLDYFYDIKNNKIYDLEEQSVDVFYCKNVIHHCKDIKNTINTLYKYLKKDGILEIIEPTKENYESNRSLDIFWYRYIILRPEIYIPPQKRIDYEEIILEKFDIKAKNIDKIYEKTIYKKK